MKKRPGTTPAPRGIQTDNLPGASPGQEGSTQSEVLHLGGAAGRPSRISTGLGSDRVETFSQVGEWDEMINAFNAQTGLLDALK
jgi:hypothetical protein